MSKINNGEAPAGYIAVKSEICTGCAFYFGRSCCGIIAGGNEPACTESTRSDGKSVIFVAAPDATSAPATLLHPMGSMGESVEA